MPPATAAQSDNPTHAVHPSPIIPFSYQNTLSQVSGAQSNFHAPVSHQQHRQSTSVPPSPMSISQQSRLYSTSTFSSSPTPSASQPQPLPPAAQQVPSASHIATAPSVGCIWAFGIVCPVDEYMVVRKFVENPDIKSRSPGFSGLIS